MNPLENVLIGRKVHVFPQNAKPRQDRGSQHFFCQVNVLVLDVGSNDDAAVCPRASLKIRMGNLVELRDDGHEECWLKTRRQILVVVGVHLRAEQRVEFPAKNVANS